jgi:hypothetical protein
MWTIVITGLVTADTTTIIIIITVEADAISVVGYSMHQVIDVFLVGKVVQHIQE